MRNTRSAGGVVLNNNGDVLVVNQRGTSWSLPKGHIDSGEEAIDAARREIKEESGVSELVLVKPLGSYKRFKIGKDGGEDKSELKSIEMFLFKTAQTELAPEDSDNPEARWVKQDEVANTLTHEKDKEFFARIMFEL